MPKKRRVQVADLSGPAPIQPQATPVDTYHTPNIAKPDTSGGSWGDWAEAIKAFQPGLNQALNSQANYLVKTQEQAKQLGAADQHGSREANKEAFKKAIASGAIRESESPWFEKGQKQGAERLRGLAFNEALVQGWSNWGEKDSTDPTKFQAWAQGFTEEYNKINPSENPLEAAEVYNPMVQQSVANLEQQHIAHVKNHIEQKFRDDTYSEISKILDMPGIQPGDVEIAGQIQNTLKYQVSLGLSGADANKLAVDAITQKAVRAGDTDVLDALDQISTGNGTLGKTQYAQEQRDQALTHIFAMENHKATVGGAAEKKAKEEAIDKLGGDILDMLEKDPTANITPGILQMNKLDYSKSAAFRTYQEQLLSANQAVHEKPEEVAQIYGELYAGELDKHEGGAKAYVLGLANAGIISSSTVKDIFKEQSIYKDHNDVLTDPNFRETERLMRSQVASDPLNISGQKQARDFTNILSREWMKWNKITPEKDRTQEAGWDFLEKLSTRLLNKQGFVPLQKEAQSDPNKINSFQSREDLDKFHASLNANGPTGPEGMHLDGLGIDPNNRQAVQYWIAKQRKLLEGAP